MDVLERDGAEAKRKHFSALQRAIPITRMVDYGVPLGDALAIHAHAERDEPDPWDQVCESLADRHLRLGMKADEARQLCTSGQEWRAASALLQCAQLAFNEDGARKNDLYERSQAALIRHAAISEDLAPCTVETESGALNGWVVRPRNGPPRGGILILGGLSGWGSVYLDMARALAARGLVAILGEGPGQGLTRLRSKIHLSASTLPLFARFLDEGVAAGAQRLGVWGNSFGGLFAAHVAALDARVRAVCINGAPMVPTVPAFRTAREQLMATLGISDEAALAKVLPSLSLHAGQQQITGSMLVLQGGRDELVPLDSQASFTSLVGKPDRASTLTWADGEHTIYNHAQERNAVVADWFLEQLS